LRKGVEGFNEPDASQEEVKDMPPYDPLVEGSKMAARLAAKEEQERIKFWKEQQGGGPGGKLRRRHPAKVTTHVSQQDITAMRDPESGRNLVKSGYAPRWIREIDNAGHPSDYRVEDMKSQGYEVVMTDNGEPLRGLFGVAMQAPIGAYAERMKLKMPTGALHQKAVAEEAVEEVNAKAGGNVARFIDEDKD
jgi:hypothetical protein